MTGSWTPPPPVAGPMPAGNIPAQPEFLSYCVSWAAFDVPRMWDMLAKEPDLCDGDDAAWVQVRGFAQLSQLLWEQHRNLRSRCAEVSQAWRSPAGAEVLSHAEAFADSLLSDAHCAQETAYGLDRILTGIAEARVKVWGLRERWDRVTTDLWPEWWDDAAEELNVEARNVMIELDEVVRTNRKKILIPGLHQFGITEPPGPLQDPSTPDHGSSPSKPIPPVPGYDPMADSGLSEAELAGIPNVPALVPAVPGAPVSMLPIPTGNQFAPYGGAYILPGPGVGRAGYVVPIPPAAGGRFSGTGGIALGRGGSGGGAGMLPMPMGMPMPGGGNASGAGGGYRRPDTAWRAEKGVPPVIDGIDADVVIPDRPSEQQEAAFKDWFAELAYPWRSESSGSQPQVTFRKVAE